MTVSEWMEEEATPALSATVWLPMVLWRVFVECRELVDGIARKHTKIMEGIGSEGAAIPADEAIVEMFRQCVRCHHRTLHAYW